MNRWCKCGRLLWASRDGAEAECGECFLRQMVTRTTGVLTLEERERQRDEPPATPEGQA